MCSQSVMNPVVTQFVVSDKAVDPSPTRKNKHNLEENSST